MEPIGLKLPWKVGAIIACPEKLLAWLLWNSIPSFNRVLKIGPWC
jgi:hypothetical protein